MEITERLVVDYLIRLIAPVGNYLLVNKAWLEYVSESSQQHIYHTHRKFTSQCPVKLKLYCNAYITCRLTVMDEVIGCLPSSLPCLLSSRTLQIDRNIDDISVLSHDRSTLLNIVEKQSGNHFFALEVVLNKQVMQRFQDMFQELECVCEDVDEWNFRLARWNGKLRPDIDDCMCSARVEWGCECTRPPGSIRTKWTIHYQIFLKTIAGRTLTLNVHRKQTVKEIEKEIERITGRAQAALISFRQCWQIALIYKP